jgi:hypothetical protein
MSTQYPGGFITKSPVAPTSTAASGIWTVDQAMQYVKAGTWPQPPSQYIEDWFNTWIYNGNNSTRTIANGINLSAYGGMVWVKNRFTGADNKLTDTARGVTKALISNSTAAETTDANGVTAFNTTGFSLGGGDAQYNSGSTQSYVSWTFAKRAKFFDIVTYTGNAAGSKTINHNLGSVPGCIIVKPYSGTSSTSGWVVYHRSMGATQAVYLDLTDSALTLTNFWNNTAPTSTQFTVGSVLNDTSTNFIAYLFAHDAGGFGSAGSDNVITCGSYTGTGAAGNPVTLGYEPQWIMIKRTDTVADWYVYDIMRGFNVATFGGDNFLRPNSSGTENVDNSQMGPTATGFEFQAGGAGYNASGGTYIYITIRRGLMKTPTVGTSVFSPIAVQAGVNTVQTTAFPVDMQWLTSLAGGAANFQTVDRLRGIASVAADSAAYYPTLITSSTAAENTTSYADSNKWGNTGFNIPSIGDNVPYIYESLRRAAGFFDVVCYTGTGANTTQAHNLQTIPQLMIVRARAGADWQVYSASLANTQFLVLNATDAVATSTTRWNSTTPTSSVFSLGTSGNVNGSGSTYVAYLFATCPGVSKVGSYTGTAALQTVNCSFTTGARFVLIKRTDSTGDWYVWDSARGISSSTDPYLLMNTTAAEVTGTNYVDTDTTGFKVTAAASTTVNISAATYIFLAIA